jgi:hypothetical protein
MGITGNVGITGNLTVGGLPITTPEVTNLIINGDFSINQRSYVSGTNSTGPKRYTLDRWFINAISQNVTFTSLGTGVVAPTNGLVQIVEDLNIEGGVYTLSWIGTATAMVNNTPILNGGNITLPAKTNATVSFFGGTLHNVQLEKGPVAHPFSKRLYPTELILCQRYYEVVFLMMLPDGSNTSRLGGNGKFDVRKRVTPNITIIDVVDSTVGKMSHVNGGGIITGCGPYNTTDSGLYGVAPSGVNQAVAGYWYRGLGLADAEL